MNKGTYTMLAGCIGLIGWSVMNSSQAEPLSYSPDRWPARWSAIVKQNQATSDQPAYGYGHSRQQVQRNENPWAHDSSTLFKVPASQRPWGEPPRKTRRERRTSYYRDQQRAVRQGQNRYEPYAYGAGISPAYPGMGFGNPYAGFGPGYSYGASPLLMPPLLASPAASPYGAYPYGAGAYPPGMGAMGWPYRAW